VLSVQRPDRRIDRVLLYPPGSRSCGRKRFCGSIFAFYGANTDLPGRDETRGLVIMLIIAGVGLGLSLLGLIMALSRGGGR
jgi:hypothetical protein